MDQYLNKWLFFPWLRNNNMDGLIHDEDVKRIEGLGIVKCVNINGKFLIVKNNRGEFRVKKEGVRRILPDPKFTWGDEVSEVNNPNVKSLIGDLFWHHEREEFLYFIEVGGKRKSKQFGEKELIML